MFAEHHGYAFDAAYGDGTTASDEGSQQLAKKGAATADLYPHVTPLVAAAQGGRSACVLLFGATGSGAPAIHSQDTKE